MTYLAMVRQEFNMVTVMKIPTMYAVKTHIMMVVIYKLQLAMQL